MVREAPTVEVSGSCRKSWDPPAPNSSGLEQTVQRSLDLDGETGQ